jgi:rubrerythrin
MYESTEVIAVFTTPAEAQVALTRLEAEGIAGAIAGDMPNAASWSLFGQMPFASIQLVVARQDAARARAILDLAGEEELDEGWESAAESAITGWICAVCDTEVADDQVVCPECGAGRQERDDEEEEEV